MCLWLELIISYVIRRVVEDDVRFKGGWSILMNRDFKIRREKESFAVVRILKCLFKRGDLQ